MIATDTSAQTIIDKANAEFNEMVANRYIMKLATLLYERQMIRDELREKEEEIRVASEEIYNLFPHPIPPIEPYPRPFHKEDDVEGER